MDHIYTRKTAYHESWISNKITEAKSRLFDRGKITRRRSAKDRGEILLAISSLHRDLEFTRRRARSILSVATLEQTRPALADGTNYYRYYMPPLKSLELFLSLLFWQQRPRQLRRRRLSTTVRNHRKTGASARKTKCGFIDFTPQPRRSLPR